MKLYKMNPHTLELELARSNNYKVIGLCAIVFLILGFSSGIKINTIVDKIPVVLRMQAEECTLDNVKQEIDRLNLRFPHIVYQQVCLESGYLKDPVFKQNNNPLCLKIATQRATTASGENLGFARYERWQDALVDYALWQEAYTRDIRTEQEYYYFLDRVYCSSDTNGGSYSSKLKRIQ